MPWRKGQTGNPGGRPRWTPEVRLAVRRLQKLAPVAVDVLAADLRSRDAKTRREAARTVLAYVLGAAGAVPYLHEIDEDITVEARRLTAAEVEALLND